MLYSGLTIFDSILVGFLFQMSQLNFFTLDVVSSIMLSFLASAFSDGAPIGFINDNTAKAAFYAVIAIMLLYLVVFVFVCLRKKWAKYALLVLTIGDFAYLLVHLFFLPDMIDLSQRLIYLIGSIAWHIWGIILCLRETPKKDADTAEGGADCLPKEE